ncbi:MAG: tetratricopeptide repeat protein [Candidatus Nitrohelix vancouverensis]|uniref:Tetratricopeptide repeat protein n=1 Tax=Candidatus Nitrohelix vancouverensis TaxID=2705534 RepID=A0A7T0C353_9BACT|nr:MAG: tetratricopeptide repeat protein [Candidatus Nitrohelix vancouverensis]
MKITTFLFLILAILIGADPAFVEGSEKNRLDTIQQGNAFYLEGRYEKAITAYESALSPEYNNGFLHYNLGNAYLRSDSLGLAILHYLKARQWIPDNDELAANLRLAFLKTKDRSSALETDESNPVFFWIDSMNFKETIWICLAFYALFWGIMAVWLYKRTKVWSQMRWLALTLFIFTAAGSGLKFFQYNSSPLGVILASTVEVKSAPGPDNTTVVELHEGAVFKIHQRREGWNQILISKGKSGWVPEQSLGLLP